MNRVEIAIQAIGFVALGCEIASVQFKKRHMILAVYMASALLFAIHFMLLGAGTGALLNLVSAGRAVIFGHYSNRRRPLWPLWVVIAAVVVVSVVTFRGWISFLPMTAMVISSVALWQRDENAMRRLLLTTVPLWLVFSVLFGSYAGVLDECIVAVSLMVALTRYRHNKPTTR